MYKDSNELYHHGVMGMHWGIRRYQPYRKGERVKGGKEVGQATKVEQRPVSYKKQYKINRKLSKNDEKILKLRSKQYGKSWAYKNVIANKINKIRKKNEKLNKKAGYSNTMETDEYRREYERVSSGGVDKKVDAAAKKAYDAQQHEKQHPSMQAYKAAVKAERDLIDAQNKYMRKTGIQRYNKDQLSRAVDSYKKATESSKKALNDFESKKFTKEMQDEYSTMRSTDPRYEKYRALKKQLYELNTAYNNDKSREQLWTDELKKLQMAHSSTDSDSLMHHGVMGMHWGIRRYQPYRKGDKVKGGKEVGKATKVEQRPIGERIKKAIASMNKIKKEIHKGSEEKAEYKFKMAQLKAAKKEVKKAQRREKEERIRERIREHREEQRMERQEAEERRERNWQRARDIANDAATIGTMLYGAYQLKKSMQGERGVGSPSGGSSPSVTTSGSGSSSGSRNRLTSYTPPGAHSPTTPSITRSGSGGSTSSTHSFSSNRAVRSEAAKAQRNSITNSINSAVTKLKNKQNKTDADRYALISLAAFKNRVSSSSDDDAMKMVNLTPDELIQRYTRRDGRLASGGYAYHADDHSDYLKHHGILGMHWGIRRYQPYPPGKKGKYLGKIDKNNAKIAKLRDRKQNRSFHLSGYDRRIIKKANKADAKYYKYKQKALSGNERAKEKMEAMELVRAKLNAKKAHSENRQNKLDSKISRLEVRNANLQRKADKEDRKTEGRLANAMGMYNRLATDERVSKANANYNKMIEKAEAAGDKKLADIYRQQKQTANATHDWMRNDTRSNFEKAKQLHAMVKDERPDMNEAKSMVREMLSERQSTATRDAKAQNEAKTLLTKYGISPKVASKVVANKGVDEISDMMKDAYKDPSLLRTAKNMTPDELERHLYG